MHESIAAELAPDGTYEPDNSVPRWLLVEPATTAASPTSIGATIGAADGRRTGGCRELGVGSVAHRADHRDANDGGGDDDDELFGLEKRIRDEVAYHQGDPRRATPIVIGQVGAVALTLAAVHGLEGGALGVGTAGSARSTRSRMRRSSPARR